MVLSMLDSPVQAASSQVASSAQLTSCTAWRQGAVAQAFQIRKQTPEGSRWGLLDFPEHPDSSQPASQEPFWPLAGPGDVALQPSLFWIPQQRSEGSCQRPQYWNLSSVGPNHQSKLCPPSLPPGAHQASCTSWRPSAVAQAVQILKQTPEGYCPGPAGLTRAH